MHVFARVSNVWSDDEIWWCLTGQNFRMDTLSGCKVIGGLLGRMLAPRPEGEAAIQPFFSWNEDSKMTRLLYISMYCAYD